MQEKVDNAIREALADSLGLLSYKARTGQMTDEDVALISRAIHVINRNLLPAPERRVYHDFAAFRKRVPAGWTKGNCKSSH